MSRVFFYTLILSFASGIFLRSFFIIPIVTTVWFGVMSLGLLGWSYRKRATASVRFVVLMTVIIIGIAIGCGRVSLAEYMIPPALLYSDVGSVHTYHGQIIREPELASNGENIVVQIRLVDHQSAEHDEALNNEKHRE